MSIVIVGGNCGMQHLYKDTCKKRGHRVKIYTKLPANFAKSIGTPDCVLFFTDNVSHKMLVTAKKEIKRKKLNCIHCHSCSLDALNTTLSKLETV